MKSLVRIASTALAMSLVPMWSACADFGMEPARDSGYARGALTAPNGLMFNSLAPNGLMFNGLMFNGLMFNGTTLEGLSLEGVTLDGEPLDPAQEQDLIEVLGYAVECALSEEESVVVVASDGTPITYHGALGLAPGWREGSLGLEGERRVSACLASRSNALAETVIISLRTPDMSVSQQERDIFSMHEGAFWGNLFADHAHIYVCVAKGGGIAGRVCAESDTCGFIFTGHCNDVCTFDAERGQYTQCQVPHGAEHTTQVVNTFLSLGRRIAYGGGSACMISKDGSEEHGTLSCWGDNTYGQLADGTTQPSQTPILISQLGNDNAELSASFHACSRKTDGSLYCWGRNDDGQVGNGAAEDQHRPVHIASNVAEVTAGLVHTCARKADSTIWCWGNNDHGQVGVGELSTSFTTPQHVSGLHASRLSSSTNARHTCAVVLDGTVRCWGKNDHGQLGDGSTQRRSLPVPVSADEHGRAFGNVTDVCTARDLSCARTADGRAWCWGQAGSAQSLRPRQLSFGDTQLGAVPDGLACGESFACFTATDSTVWCLGENQHGQLGYDTGGAPSSSLHPVQGLDRVGSLNAARTHACALRADRSAWCWGTDPGRMDGLPAEPLFPDDVLTIQPARVQLP